MCIDRSQRDRILDCYKLHILVTLRHGTTYKNTHITAMRSDLAGFSKVLDLIYEASITPSIWPEALLEASSWVSASKALLFTPGSGLTNGGFYFSHGVSSEEMTLWSSRYVGEDFWSQRVVERQLAFEGSVMLDSELSSREELLNSDYYRNHICRMKISRLLSGIVLAPSDGSSPVVACSFYRGGTDDHAFTSLEKGRMELLLPHLSRSVGVMLRLRTAEMRASANAFALDALQWGIVQLNAHGEVIQENAKARQIWSANDGIQCIDKHIVVARGPVSNDLSRALRATLSQNDVYDTPHFSAAVKIPRLSGKLDYLVQMSRMPAHSSSHSIHAAARAIVFITDSHLPMAANGKILANTYQLTPAEIRAALALANGDSIAAASSTLCISENTLKTHLKNIYAKTGCSNRSELTRLIFSIAKLECDAP